MDFAKRFPNVEKTEYFSSADSIRIYGSAYIFDEDTSYITDIIPNTMFGRNCSNNWDCEDGWDRYESYSVILHHGSRCRTGEFSTGKELEDLIHELFDTDDPAGFFYQILILMNIMKGLINSFLPWCIS
ncbi:hypothetical protein [Butyrivibrio sp. WCE2006]|uniref:hypothetical protein n=1 Tax=Butyrivibrio sp. WCE2006 TaxID=1410611 RepID=UPI001A9A6E91